MSYNHKKRLGLGKRLILSAVNITMHNPIGAALSHATRWLYLTNQNHWVDLTHIPLALPRLPASFDGYRIAQISDFHLGTWLSQDKLAQVIDLVNQQTPDLVAITGDLVAFDDGHAYEVLTQELGKLQARDHVVAVLGNHDHWSNPEMIRHALQTVGIRELNNCFEILEHGDSRIYLCGIDDYMTSMDRLGDVLNDLPPEGCAILLAHEPDFADISAATGRFDLQISGHSHGGQIVFPWIGSLYLPEFARKYTSGLYQINSMLQYTNRGLGTAEFQVRWNCPPEITIFTLQSVKGLTKDDSF